VKGWSRFGALGVACAFLLALPGAASAKIFLQLDGIPGESTTLGFENQIELNTMQVGVGRGSKGAAFSDVTVTKNLDKATPELMLRAANGATIPTAKVRFTRAAEDSDVYLRYCFTGVRITSFSQSSGGEAPSESVAFSYSSIVQSYTQQSTTGGAGTVFDTGWDLLKNLELATACNN
jgi:type VI secretion system secreted protein Hcp